MAQQNLSDNYLVISYLAIRKAVGFIGIALPIVVCAGARLLQGLSTQSSISYYYYTDMRDVFVGILSSIAIFMASYKGYDLEDARAGKIACLCALGTAFFPTTPDNPADYQKTIGIIHAIFASLFFLTISYFCLVLFVKTDKAQPGRMKIWRNRVYRTCGYTMLTAIALVSIYSAALPDSTAAALERYHPVFWLESIAVEAFGFAWMTKGEAILQDEV